MNEPLKCVSTWSDWYQIQIVAYKVLLITYTTSAIIPLKIYATNTFISSLILTPKPIS